MTIHPEHHYQFLSSSTFLGLSAWLFKWSSLAMGVAKITASVLGQ
jgi:hypothetical protein